MGLIPGLVQNRLNLFPGPSSPSQQSKKLRLNQAYKAGPFAVAGAILKLRTNQVLALIIVDRPGKVGID